MIYAVLVSGARQSDSVTLLFSCSVVSDSLQPHELQHARLPCPSPSPGAYSNACPLSRRCHQSSCPLSFLSPLPSIFTSIRVFSHEPALHVRWPKYWSFSISPSTEYLELISIRIDWFWSPCSPRGSQKSAPTPRFESINSSALSLLYGLSLWSHSHMTTGKIIALTGPLSAKRIWKIIDIHICIHMYAYMYVYVYIHIYLFFFRFFSLIGYYKILSIVPCAIQ